MAMTDVTNSLLEARKEGPAAITALVERLLNIPEGSLNERKAAMNFIGIPLALPMPEPVDGVQRSFVYRDSQLFLVEPDTEQNDTE